MQLMADIVQLTDFTPKWLSTPASLATDTNFKTGPHLFRKLARETKLEWPLTRIGIGIVNLFQHSVDILGGICGHEHSAKKVEFTSVFGEQQAAVWSLGLVHQVQQFIRERLEAGLAFKANQLVTRVMMLFLRGQFQELEARQASSYDYKKTAQFMDSYPSLGFPVALLTLFKTGDLAAAYNVLQDEDLAELGYWFHAEKDLLEQFEVTRSRNSENRDYTVFIDILSSKFEPGEFTFPVRELVLDYLHGHDIFYKYVVRRERAIKAFDAEVKENGVKHVAAHAKQIAVKYFRNNFQLNAYTIQLPDQRNLTKNPKAVGREFVTKFNEWVRQLPKDSVVHRLCSQPDFFDWIAYSFPFIQDVDTLTEVNKMSVLYMAMDALLGRSLHLIKDVEAVFEDCAKPEFIEGKVNHRPVVWSDPAWHLIPQLKIVLKELVQSAKRLQQPKMLGDFGLFRQSLLWIRGIRALREMGDNVVTGDGDMNLEEYYSTIRSHESEALLWAHVVSALRKKEANTDLGSTYTATAAFVSFMRNDVFSYGNDVIANKGRPRSQRRSTILNMVDNYRLLKHPDESIQDITFRLSKEEARIREYLTSVDGTDTGGFMAVMFLGWQYHVFREQYERSVHVSNNSAICLLE